MLTTRFVRACAITELVFPRNHAIDFSITSSQPKHTDWGWASRSYVQSSNHMAAQSRRRMLRVEVRGSALLFRRSPNLWCDRSERSRIRDLGRSSAGSSRDDVRHELNVQPSTPNIQRSTGA